jgi:CRP-like cAMP-binding protein
VCCAVAWLWQGVGAEWLGAGTLMAYFEEVEAAAGQVLCRSGQASNHLYFIRTGVVEQEVL